MMDKPETLTQKIMIILIGTIVASLLGWGVWVTTQTFAIDDIKSCVVDNENKIEKESEKREKQIADRMDKQDKKMTDIYNQLIKLNRKLGDTRR